MELSVRSDLEQVTRELSREFRRQVPFAAARALTRTAWDVAKKGLNPEMARAFDYSSGGSKGYFERGWKVDKATKTDLTARLSHRSPIIDKQVNPGRYSGRAFASDRLGIYGRLGGKLEVAVRMPGVKTRSPKTLKKAFRVPVKNGKHGLQGLIVRRTGKAGAQARRVAKAYGVSRTHAREYVRRQGTQVMFGLFDAATVKSPLDLEGASRKVYEQVWPRNFDASLGAALRGARV